MADGSNVREMGFKSWVVVACMEWSSIVDDWFCSHLNSRKPVVWEGWEKGVKMRVSSEAVVKNGSVVSREAESPSSAEAETERRLYTHFLFVLM